MGISVVTVLVTVDVTVMLVTCTSPASLYCGEVMDGTWRKAAVTMATRTTANPADFSKLFLGRLNLTTKINCSI